MSSSLSQDLQFALQVSSMAAFAIPGLEGILLATGLSSLSYMLSGPPPAAATPAQVQSIVSGALNASNLSIANANVQSATEQFAGYVGPDLQFIVDIPASLNDASPTDPGLVFYKLLTSWVLGEAAGSSILIDEINSLEPSSQSSNSGAAPTYDSPEVMNFNAFLRAVSFYLIVYKAWAIFGEKGGAPFNPEQCGVVQSQLQGWLSFAQTLNSSIGNQFNTRLQQVTPVTTASTGGVLALLAEDPPYVTYFADNGGPVPGFSSDNYAFSTAGSSAVPSGNNVIASNWNPDNDDEVRNAIETNHDGYVNDLTAALIQSLGDYDSTQQATPQILGNWSAMSQELTYMLAHRGLSPVNG